MTLKQKQLLNKIIREEVSKIFESGEHDSIIKNSQILAKLSQAAQLIAEYLDENLEKNGIDNTFQDAIPLLKSLVEKKRKKK